MGGNETRKPTTTASALGATAGTEAVQMNIAGFDATVELGKGIGIDPVAMLADSVKNSNEELKQNLAVAENSLSASQIRIIEMSMQFSEAATGIIQGGLQNMAVGIGEALGNAIASGGNLLGALGGVLLGGIGDIAVQLGKTAIGIGIAMKAIKMSFKNPGTAIAAGIALIAIGSMIKSVVPGIVQGKGKGGGGSTSSGPRSGAIAAFANGGIVSGPTLGLMGEYAGARSNPEVIAPLDRLKNMIGDRQAQQVNVGGEFKLQGQDLVVALQRAEKQRGRIK